MAAARCPGEMLPAHSIRHADHLVSHWLQNSWQASTLHAFFTMHHQYLSAVTSRTACQEDSDFEKQEGSRVQALNEFHGAKQSGYLQPPVGA